MFYFNPADFALFAPDDIDLATTFRTGKERQRRHEGIRVVRKLYVHLSLMVAAAAFDQPLPVLNHQFRSFQSRTLHQEAVCKLDLLRDQKSQLAN